MSFVIPGSSNRTIGIHFYSIYHNPSEIIKISNFFQLCGCDSIGHFHAIYCNENGDIILIVEKEFGEEFDKMKFKSQTTTSSGGLEEPCKGDCVLPFKGGCYKPVTCPPIRNALLTYYWLPYKGHFLVIS